MKKILAIVLTVFMALQMIPFSVLAEERNADMELEETSVHEASDVNAVETTPEGGVKATSAIAIDEDHFPDEAFRSYIGGNIDTDQDDYLSAAEIDAVDDLFIRWLGIYSLEGIEYFTELTELNCFGNQLAELDLSGNPKVERVYCYDNQITSINVSSNAALVTLYCSGNQLRELDVTGNPALNALNCETNQLTALDLSKNTALANLNCNFNQLTVLDISNNPSLWGLSCAYNQLTELDVSGHSGLMELNCYGNQLSELNVTNNGQLTKLNCYDNQIRELDVSHNPNLTELNCSGNQLTSLDVRGNTSLEVLGCGGNQLTTLDVTSNSLLRTIGCWNNQLTGLDLSGNSSLHELDCYNNQLTALNITDSTELQMLNCQMNQLTELDVSNNTELNQISCSYNSLTSLDVRSNSELEILECIGNQLTSLQLNNPKLYSLSAQGNSLAELDISGCGKLMRAVNKGDITNTPEYMYYSYYDADFGYASLFIDNETRITGTEPPADGITINADTFPDDALRTYVEANIDLDGNSSLSEEERASVTGMYINSLGISSLAGLQYFPNLETVNCSYNQLTELDLSDNPALVTLDCFNSQISALNVSENTELEYLQCGENLLTELDVSHNPKLLELSCNNNQLTELNLAGNVELTYLYCSSNQLTELNISNCTKIEVLACGFNQLTVLDISRNTSLLNLYCENNMITDLIMGGYSALAYISCENNRLTTLDLTFTPLMSTLNCRNNGLTEIKLGFEGEYPELSQMFCNGNNLSELDISRCPNLLTMVEEGEMFEYDDCWGYHGPPDSFIMYLDYGTELLTSAVVGAEFSYTAGNGMAVITGYNGAAREVIIPESIDGYTVTAIADNAFRSNTEITKVTVPESVTEIGEFAFADCTSLTEAILPAGLTEIAFGLFMNCPQLSIVNIPDGVTAIGERAFEGDGLTEVTIPDGVTDIGYFAFSGCGNLQSVTIPGSVERMMDSVFGECGLKAVTFKPGVTRIPSRTFAGCVELTTVLIPNTVTRIGDTAFWGCTGLTEIGIPKSVTVIESSAFYKCFNITDVYYYGGTEEMWNTISIGPDNESLTSATRHYEVPVTEATLPDGTFCAYVEDNIDTDGDGYLTEEELCAVTSLDLSEQEITSVTGLEYFTELRSLNCAGNQLEELDVSLNTALEELDCSDNHLTSLTLNSGKTAADTNNGGASAGMMSLKAAAIKQGDVGLYRLICNGNDLAELDISGSKTLIQIVSEGQVSEKDGYVEYSGPEEGYLLRIDKDTVLQTEQSQPSGVPIDEEHFPDANFRACVSADFDTDKSGYLEAGEIENAVGFYESGRDIADMKGIEYLTDLQYLTCSSNRLEKLDLSKNKMLIRLECMNNQLTELNVSGNPALEKIVCIGNNLEELDLSGNPALKELECGDNLLKELDVSHNPAMTYVDCKYNQISLLDVSACETLVRIVTEGSYSSYDGWKSYFLWGTGSVVTDVTTRILPIDSGLAVSPENFPDEMFRAYVEDWLDPDRNGYLTDKEIAAVTAMDYLTNRGIVSLQGIEYFTELQGLDCRDNMLAALDLSKNTSLTWVRCDNNGLTSLVFGENSKLTHVTCITNQLTELNLSGVPNLEALSCYDNSIAELDIRSCPNLITAYNSGGSESLYNDTIPVYVWMTEDYSLAVDLGTAVKVSDVEVVPAFKSQSLVLSGQIGLNFFLELPEIPGVDYSKSYMTFTIGRSLTEYRDDFDPGHMNSAGTRYGFTCYVNSIQMADTIKAVFHYGNNRTVTKEYSVAQYIDFFEKNINSFNAKTIALIHAIADFGHYEQIYLADVNHWAIGESYAEMEKYYTETYDYSTILSAVNSKAFVKTLGNSDVEKATYKLHLDSETTVDVFLTPKNGKTLTASATFNGKTYTAVKQSDGRYLVQIPNISAHQLGDMITITGTAGTAFSVQVSALSYTRSVLNSTSTNQAAKDGLSALYAYYSAVLAYRK